MTDKNRFHAGTALGLVAAAVLGFGAARFTQSAPAAKAPDTAQPTAPADTVTIDANGIRNSAIMVAPASAGELDTVLRASATVEAAPNAEAVLTAHAAGTVTRILKRVGDAVRAGETLALVESRDASAIAADRASASARFGLASRQLAREKLLLSQGVSPRTDYETAEANLAVARADARRASAAAGAAHVAGDGRSVVVASPVAGRVTAAPGRLGQYVGAETELFRVVDARELQIIASLPAADAAHVREGDRVELLSDGKSIEAVVRSATGVVDPQSRAATVVITPRAGVSTLLPGQLVQARIFGSTGAKQKTVTVPQDAVQTLGDRTVVFARTRAGFRAVPVVVGSRSAGQIAIASGIAARTLVATGNAFLLKAELEKNQGGDD